MGDILAGGNAFFVERLLIKFQRPADGERKAETKIRMGEGAIQ
jgi:hypothetical protein